MRTAALLSCVLAAPLLLAASQPIRLGPSSPWVVDYAENSCRLVRTFGEGKDKTKFALESDSPGQADMLVIGKPLRNNSDEVSARFLPVQVKPMEGRSAQSVENHDPAILWSRVTLLPDDVAEQANSAYERRSKMAVRPPALDLADEARTKAMRRDFVSKAIELEIMVHRGRPVVLETGSLDNAIKTFDECSRESLRDWGVDPDVEEKIARPVWAPDAASWFSAYDYPETMVRRGEESVVKVRLLVDASGRPTKCTSLSHFKEVSFNDVVCARFMKRAHFEPAELANGTKVPSYYTNTIVFRMPR